MYENMGLGRGAYLYCTIQGGGMVMAEGEGASATTPQKRKQSTRWDETKLGGVFLPVHSHTNLYLQILEPILDPTISQ